jgi:two-component system phosphate regulon sensor histidine kinase PhoR
VASEADRQTYYEFLHGESDRLRRLVEGLLDFGRLQTGKVEFKLEAVDAAAFLRESAAEFSKAHPGITHQIVIHPPAASVSVQADREALRCALWNLLENAVKYSPDREAVHVEAARAGRFLEIAVRDEGIGIPRHEQRRIFDRFTRGAGARERHIGGTGIGLATAREIVRAHGGDIVVESEPGLGSTFTIRLPPRAVSKATVDDRDSSLAGETGR